MWTSSDCHLLLCSCCRDKSASKQPSLAVMACIVNNSQSTPTSAPAQQEDDIRYNRQGPDVGSTVLTPAVTPAVAASSSPVWNHCLNCEFDEGQWQTGLLQLALLNEADGAVITR